MQNATDGYIQTNQRRMTLRGHGSLQEVIGRPNQYRKRKTQAASSDNEHNLVQSSIYKPPATSAAPQPHDKTLDKKPRLLQRKLQLQPEPAGHTLGPTCPVCGITLPTNNHALNQHIGTQAQLCTANTYHHSTTTDACLLKPPRASTPSPQGNPALPTSIPPTTPLSPTPWQSIGLCPVARQPRASKTSLPSPGAALIAAPEPQNARHAHALRCMHDDTAVGYLPMAVADALAPALAAGLLQGVRIVLQGGGKATGQLVGMLQALRVGGVRAPDVEASLQQAAKAAASALEVASVMIRVQGWQNYSGV